MSYLLPHKKEIRKKEEIEEGLDPKFKVLYPLGSSSELIYII